MCVSGRMSRRDCVGKGSVEKSFVGGWESPREDGRESCEVDIAETCD